MAVQGMEGMLIALEEHYLDPTWNKHFDSKWHKPRPASPLLDKLLDIGAKRIAEMDAAGIGLQVISHAPPGAQGIAPEAAASWSREANDRLHAEIQKHPSRLAGFASVSTENAADGAKELERAVNTLDFKGAILHSLSEGPFLDDRKYWQIFEAAEALDRPIYIHPGDPGPSIIAAYYGDYAKTHPMFIRAGWGYMVEAGTQAMRLVLSGIFDQFPRLKLILGHLGETIPYQITRIDEALSRDTPMKNFREVFTRHFYVTTSGFFSDAALQCCIAEIGVDRVMFSVDWPFASNKLGSDWIRSTRLEDADRNKIMSGNARNLLKL